MNKADMVSALITVKYNLKTFSKNTEKKAERKQTNNNVEFFYSLLLAKYLYDFYICQLCFPE